ncbi:gem-associated protein 6-like [Branchiostoma lanceolatum]|uniref:Gem-associated protein 6 n=1 Tax=Branchiostoma lanceolatum TaxID=7740 RepID=A0A8K0ENU6_BRALA|nr:GEMIN6 [Branchiostoma lanceolatum]
MAAPLSSEADRQQFEFFANSEHRPPGFWRSYVYKEIEVTTVDGRKHLGWVYTVDPVSESVVLAQFEEDREKTVEIVMRHAIKGITVVNEDIESHKEELDHMFITAEDTNFSKHDLKTRRDELKLWLEKNRLPVKVSGKEGELLSISDALVIEPPYSAESCRSTNEIILGRIQALIRSKPTPVQ